MDGRNPLARFEKAAVLESTGRLAEALQELAHLRDLLPREGSVHFKMGRVASSPPSRCDIMQCCKLSNQLAPVRFFIQCRSKVGSDCSGRWRRCIAV